MSRAEPIAILEDVGKRYVKFEDVPTMLSGMRRLLKRGQKFGKRKQLWAVRHFDLEVRRGEAVGIIGRNGSGKSTTLAMMSGVTAPTEGRVSVNGRVAPLLRLGVGFQPEMTGRENVYVNGMILGMSKDEITRNLDEVVEFAELEEFMDTPTKFYSTGMNVRLGFASAISAKPDLLIVDEVLSVGDIGFQAKSFDRMLEMREGGATLVIVSHNMAAVRRLAERVIVLHDGKIQFHGPTDEAISLYHELMRPGNRAQAKDGERDADAAEIVSFETLGPDGVPSYNIRTGEVAIFRMRVRFKQAAEGVTFGAAISTQSAQWVYGENSFGSGPQDFAAGEEATFVVRVPILMVSGTYNVTCGVRWGGASRSSVTTPMRPFYVSGRENVMGVADLGATFEVEERTAGAEEPSRASGPEPAVPSPGGLIDASVPDSVEADGDQR